MLKHIINIIKKTSLKSKLKMKTLNFKQLQGFFENEIDSRECAHSLDNLIEFSSILYMVACEGEETTDKVHNYIGVEMADYAANIHLLARIFSDMKTPSDVVGLEKMFESVSPSELAKNLTKYSFGINTLLALISGSQQTAFMLKQLGSSEFYDSLRLLTNLSNIFANLEDFDKILLALENKVSIAKSTYLQKHAGNL